MTFCRMSPRRLLPHSEQSKIAIFLLTSLVSITWPLIMICKALTGQLSVCCLAAFMKPKLFGSWRPRFFILFAFIAIFVSVTTSIANRIISPITDIHNSLVESQKNGNFSNLNFPKTQSLIEEISTLIPALHRFSDKLTHTMSDLQKQTAEAQSAKSEVMALNDNLNKLVDLQTTKLTKALSQAGKRQSGKE